MEIIMLVFLCLGFLLFLGMGGLAFLLDGDVRGGSPGDCGSNGVFKFIKLWQTWSIYSENMR